MKTLTLLAICAVGMAFGQDVTSPTSGLTIIKNDSTTPEWKSCALKIWRETDHGTLECISGDTPASQFLTEPLDVPAIQELTREQFNCSGNALSGSAPNGWYQWGTKSDGMTVCGPKRPMVTTCKDKSRILEHDENDPPKYWCRKVQN